MKWNNNNVTLYASTVDAVNVRDPKFNPEHYPWLCANTETGRLELVVVHQEQNYELQVGIDFDSLLSTMIEEFSLTGKDEIAKQKQIAIDALSRAIATINSIDIG